MIIIALLMIIICILLFGAAAVRDLLFKVVCLGSAVITLLFVMVLAQKVLGPNGIFYLGFGVLASLGGLGLWVRYDDSHAVKMRRKIRQREKDKRDTEAAKMAEAHRAELKIVEARERFEATYGNGPNLTKMEKKQRKDAVLGRSKNFMDENEKN